MLPSSSAPPWTLLPDGALLDPDGAHISSLAAGTRTLRGRLDGDEVL
jgi:hypothetical protein